MENKDKKVQITCTTEIDIEVTVHKHPPGVKPPSDKGMIFSCPNYAEGEGHPLAYIHASIQESGQFLHRASHGALGIDPGEPRKRKGLPADPQMDADSWPLDCRDRRR